MSHLPVVGRGCGRRLCGCVGPLPPSAAAEVARHGSSSWQLGQDGVGSADCLLHLEIGGASTWNLGACGAAAAHQRLGASLTRGG